MNNKEKLNMKNEFMEYGGFIEDTFCKLDFSFKKKKKILDLGCGNGVYCNVFANIYGLETHGMDIYKDKEINNIKNIKFRIGNIYNTKFKDKYFDYIFLHDVLHHIDEEKQSYKRHQKAMEELKRITKKGGSIIIVEANRYNPLFYPHMVLLRGHNHWRQSYFKKVMTNAYVSCEYEVRFKHFESHFYQRGSKIGKIYEKIMEFLPTRTFRAYNVCIATKK